MAFDAKGKQYVFLEFTRLLDLVSILDEGEWAERKELEKNERYAFHRYFINDLSALKGKLGNRSQINFAVGARGSFILIEFQKTSPFWGNELKSQRQNPSVYGVKNTSLV